MRPHSLALWLAGGVPFVAYVVTASGFAYWLDSGEFVAAAVQLDIAHPPGHPLSALYGKALSLLPFGSLSFRIALGQALAGALGAALHARATIAALSGMGLPGSALAALGVAAAWLSAFTFGLWFQAVRPEVYALQTLCNAWFFERVCAALAQTRLARSSASGETAQRARSSRAARAGLAPRESAQDAEPAPLPAGSARDARPLIGAGLALGLALTNHHLITLLVAPAALPALWLALRARRWRSAACAAGAGALGLGGYLYLPLRAANAPALNLGDPRNFENFWWVVSARVYAHDMGRQAAQPLGERALDVLALLVENFQAVPLLLALLGLYLLARHPGTRASALSCGLMFGVDAGARAWLGPVRANPDILGYLAPSFLAIGTLAAGCLGACGWLIAERWPALRPRLSLLAAGVPIAALAGLPESAAHASLRDFASTDALDDARVRALAARAVVLESMPQTAFRAWELDAVERSRPDLIHVALPFMRYPGMSEALRRAHPELREVVESYLARHDRLEMSAVARLARDRPVFVELDTRLPSEGYRALRPRGVLAQLADSGSASLAELRQELDRSHAQLVNRLGSDLRETETARQLLWVHYMNAVHLAALGARGLAQAEAARGLELHAHDARLQQLARALAEPGPLALQPFLEF